MAWQAARRILIVGAGPAGLATAILLRRIGLEVAVHERDEGALAGGNALTLWPNAFSALEFIGVAEAVMATSAPANGLAMRNSTGETLSFVSRTVMESRCGGTGRALLRQDLMRILSHHLDADIVRFGARCVGLSVGAAGVAVRFADGTEVEGDLVIGADGIRSAVRAALFGPDDLRFLGYAVARGISRTSLPAIPGQLSMGAGQQFGLFPMADHWAYWFAAFNAAEGSALRDSGHRRFLAERFADWHHPIPQVIDATDPDDLLVTDIYDRPPLRRWSSGGVTLIGDAAHPSGPALGQGTCQAFEDAVVLADCLARDADLVAALRRYQAVRRRRTNRVTAESHWMGKLGQWRNPILCRARNLMIKVMPELEQVSRLRRMFSFNPEGRTGW